jgi:hypothetical protein
MVWAQLQQISSSAGLVQVPWRVLLMSMSGCLMGHVNVNVWVFDGLCQCSFAWHVLSLPCSLNPTLISGWDFCDRDLGSCIDCCVLLLRNRKYITWLHHNLQQILEMKFAVFFPFWFAVYFLASISCRLYDLMQIHSWSGGQPLWPNEGSSWRLVLCSCHNLRVNSRNRFMWKTLLLLNICEYLYLCNLWMSITVGE